MLILRGLPRAKAANLFITDVQVWRRGERTRLETWVVHAVKYEYYMLVL